MLNLDRAPGLTAAIISSVPSTSHAGSRELRERFYFYVGARTVERGVPVFNMGYRPWQVLRFESWDWLAIRAAKFGPEADSRS